jgi:hypothetical protein
LVRFQLAPQVFDVSLPERPNGRDIVRMLRRALVALGLAGLIAAVLRIRGSGGVPPQSGGWRELSGPGFE